MLTLSHSVSDRNADPILEFAKPVKEHLITSDTVLEDYQVMMDLDAITGTDSGDDAYGLEVETDGNNLVLLTEDGQVIPFWIEEHTGRARIWAKMPLISPNTCVKLLEYPRNYFPSRSDGNATFLFFDGFDRADSADVGNGWIEDVNIGSIDTNRLKMVGSTTTVPAIKKAYSFSSPVTVETLMKSTAKGAGCFNYIHIYGGSPNQRFGFAFYGDNGDISYLDNTGWVEAVDNYIVDQYYRLRIDYLQSSGKSNYYVDGVSKHADTNPYTSPLTNLITFDISGSSVPASYNDWILIRKYADTEPTHSSWNDISIPSGDTGRFRYKKTHILTGDSGWSGDQTGYPIMLKVYRTSGTDSGSSVYVDTNVRTDYRDLLFMDGNGCILPFWIESIDTTNNYATVWVRMPTIAKTGNTTLYMLYGNPRATDRSSGAATFDFFDDFNEPSLNSSRWSQSGSISIANSLCTVGTGPSEISSHSSFNTNTALLFRSYLPAAQVNHGFWTAGNSNYALHQYDGAYYTNSANSEGNERKSGSNLNGWRTREILRNGLASVIFKTDDTIVNTHSSRIPDGGIQVRFYTYSGSATGSIIDWIAVRKFVSPEPAHGSWSTSEV